MNRNNKGLSFLGVVLIGAIAVGIAAGAFVFMKKTAPTQTQPETKTYSLPTTPPHTTGPSSMPPSATNQTDSPKTTDASTTEKITVPPTPKDVAPIQNQTPPANPQIEKVDQATTETNIFTFTFSNGVNAQDESFIRKGITASDKYLRQWFGQGIKTPTEIKVSPDTSTQGCCHVGEGSSIFFHTGHTDWQQASLAGFLFADLREQLAMHELVHIYQAENGCGRQDQPVQLRWLQEGMAEWLSFKMLSGEGIVSDAQSLNYNILSAKLDKIDLLKNYETNTQGLRYHTFFLAINQLMKTNPMSSLNVFCENLGKGQNGPDAFQTSFGTSLSKFYEDFEAYRSTL